MSLTYAAQQSAGPARKSSVIIVVALLHVGAFYAFTHGLDVVKMVAPLKDTVAVFIPEDKQPPPELPKPDVRPLDIPIDTPVPAVPVTMAEAEIPPEVPVTIGTGEAAITPDTVGASEVSPARSFSITHRVDPVYPAAARRAGQSGTVLLNIVVGPNGSATEVNVERSSGFMALDDAAVSAVRKWRFSVSGDSNYSRVRLPVAFKLAAVQ